ncbi:MAG TPA: sigma-54 dependent transcriptional regulator [Gemmatimonadaceae bacterium]|nr:sigma-54 dependent transcriptional regulator [Gemmatimonadaceae bacterium]
MTKPKILIADDERAITDGLSAILSDEGYEIDIAADGQKALERLTADRYGVVLADLKMPKLDGLALLKTMQEKDVPTQCFIITGQGNVEIAVDAIKKGAYDYIEKPLNAEKLNKLRALIPRAFEKYALQQKNRELSSRLEGLTHYGELTGQSDEMRSVYAVIDAVASSTASVLILGESGTGKELVARAIHAKSERAKGPFLALNCAALPKDILENELFGHEKGAFTGSTNEKPGAFEMADGGTLFLDEVAEMATDIQVKLLRAIETRSVRRLGGKREIAVDIRIVAATNKDLQKALADAELREDLYYRLAVVDIFLPPLRERVGDIKLLAIEFLERFASQNGKQVTTFDDSAWAWILGYHWPGNVRELKNAVERAVIMSRGTQITAADIMPRHLRVSAEMPALTIAVGSRVDDARRQLTLRTLATTGGDLARSAKMLGISVAEIRADVRALLEQGADGEESGLPASASAENNGHGNGALRAPAGDRAKAVRSQPAKPKPPAGKKR